MEAALNRLILSDEQWDYGDVPDAPWATFELDHRKGGRDFTLPRCRKAIGCSAVEGGHPTKVGFGWTPVGPLLVD